MEYFTDLKAAQSFHEELGGWLLYVGPDDKGVDYYFVTEDEGLVIDLRDREFIDLCERLECWDETEPQFWDETERRRWAE